MPISLYTLLSCQCRWLIATTTNNLSFLINSSFCLMPIDIQKTPELRSMRIVEKVSLGGEIYSLSNGHFEWQAMHSRSRRKRTRRKIRYRFHSYRQNDRHLTRRFLPQKFATAFAFLSCRNERSMRHSMAAPILYCHAWVMDFLFKGISHWIDDS